MGSNVVRQICWPPHILASVFGTSRLDQNDKIAIDKSIKYQIHVNIRILSTLYSTALCGHNNKKQITNSEIKPKYVN